MAGEVVGIVLTVAVMSRLDLVLYFLYRLVK